MCANVGRLYLHISFISLNCKHSSRSWNEQESTSTKIITNCTKAASQRGQKGKSNRQEQGKKLKVGALSCVGAFLSVDAMT